MRAPGRPCRIRGGPLERGRGEPTPRAGSGTSFADHPAGAYERLFDFAILGLLMFLVRRWGGTGRVFWVYIMLYSLGRFLVSFLRVDPAQGPLQLAQWLGLAGMAV